MTSAFKDILLFNHGHGRGYKDAGKGVVRRYDPSSSHPVDQGYARGVADYHAEHDYTWRDELDRTRPCPSCGSTDNGHDCGSREGASVLDAVESAEDVEIMTQGEKLADEFEVKRAAALKTYRAAIRLKHALRADEEIAQTLPKVEARIDAALANGEPLVLDTLTPRMFPES